MNAQNIPLGWGYAGAAAIPAPIEKPVVHKANGLRNERAELVDRNARIFALHEGGKSMRLIGYHFGISEQRVHQIIGNERARRARAAA